MGKVNGLDTCIGMLLMYKKRECSLCKKPVTGDFMALVTIHYSASAEPDCVCGVDILCTDCLYKKKEEINNVP